MAETVSYMDQDVTLDAAVLSVDTNRVASFTIPALPSNYMLLARTGITTILLPGLDYTIDDTTLTFMQPMSHTTKICAVDLSDGSVAWTFDFVNGSV